MQYYLLLLKYILLLYGRRNLFAAASKRIAKVYTVYAFGRLRFDRRRSPLCERCNNKAPFFGVFRGLRFFAVRRCPCTRQPIKPTYTTDSRNENIRRKEFAIIDSNYKVLPSQGAHSESVINVPFKGEMEYQRFHRIGQVK